MPNLLQPPATLEEQPHSQADTVELSIVIPAFNEQENLLNVFEDMVTHLNEVSLEGRYELIFVNDGSADNTGSLINDLSEKYAFVKVFHHLKNQGMGASLVTGFRQTQGMFVTLLPADGEIGIDNVLRFHQAIGDSDLLVSSRYCSNEEIQKSVRPLHREILSWGNRTLMRLILGFDPKGMEGIFLIRGDILREINFKSQSGLVILEIIYRCHRLKYKICRDVMVVQPRLRGQSKVTNLRMIFKTFLDMFRIRLSCN